MKGVVSPCLLERELRDDPINVCFLVTLGKLMALILGFLTSEMETIAGWQSVFSPVQIPCLLPCFLCSFLRLSIHFICGLLHSIFYQVHRILFLDHSM